MVVLLSAAPALVFGVLTHLLSIPVMQVAWVVVAASVAVTALVKSPACARVVSHPVFAGAAILIGAWNLVPWGISEAPAAPGGIGLAEAIVQMALVPALAAVAVVIGVRSFVKGFQAARAARTLAWKIAAVDAAMAQRAEAKEDLKRLQVGVIELLSRLNRVDPYKTLVSPAIRQVFSDLSARTVPTLSGERQGVRRPNDSSLKKAGEALKRAFDFLKDLRDERAMRIAAAAYSSREAQNEFDPNKDENIRQEVRNAEMQANEALQEAIARAEYLEQQVLTETSRISAFLGMVVSNLEPQRLQTPSDTALEQVIQKARDLQALLVKGKREAHDLRVAIALTIEPKGSLKEWWQHRRRVERFLSGQKEYGDTVARVEAQTFDAVRVAQASPHYWVNEARGRPTLTQEEKKRLKTAGVLVQPILLWAFVVVATALLAVTVAALFLQEGGSTVSVLHRLFGCAAGLLTAAFTSIALYLSNVRLGCFGFNVAPLLHEQISGRSEGVFYNDPANAKLNITRAERVVRPLPPQETKDYLKGCMQIINKMIDTLNRLEKDNLEIPIDQFKDLTGADWKRLGREFSTLRNASPSVQRKIERAAERRTYRYDNVHPSSPEERRSLRTAVKQLPFAELQEVFEEGQITNQDIWNMILDHPSTNDGAIFPRDIREGEIFRKISRMVKEADEKGVFRPFIGVKDLFGGLDGAANAGSKFAHISDMPKSELVKSLLKQGFLPIPVGLSAGANAGTGLENGHSGVGNPLHRDYDPGGSSSSVAYLLGLKDFPVHLYIGTDTGGSVSAPIGAIQHGCAYISKWITRTGMLSYSTTLDTIGIMGQDQGMVLKTMLSLISLEHLDLQFAPSKEPPVYYVFKSDLELPLLKQDDPLAKEVVRKFNKVVDRLDQEGRVIRLGSEYDDWREFPLYNYRVSFVEALYALFNPAQKNRFGEPTRVVMDSNLLNRFGKALILLRHRLRMDATQFGQRSLSGRSLFQALRELRNVYSKLHEERWPQNAVLLQPSPIPVKLAEFRTGGQGGDLTDDHDRTGMQKQIHPGWDQFISGDEGYVITGRPEYLMHVLLREEAINEDLRKTVRVRLSAL